MKKTIKLAVVAALALGTTSAFATNGDNMIGQGAQSRSMGGVGIAKSFGAASALANPALLSSVEKSEFTGAVTAFMPDVAFATGTASQVDSDADFNLIPELYYANRINSNLVYGISVSGTAGMGTDYDYTTANGAFRMKTALQLLKVSIPLSYEMNEMTFGISPVLQYGTLQLSHLTATGLLDNGESSDTGFGYELGATYNVSKDLTFGAVYKSKIGMTYNNTLSASLTAFNVQNSITSGDNLDQPAEYGVGMSYTSGANTLALDYKRIDWGSAAGYKDFGWVDQNVYIFGYEYATDGWALRVGYNYAKSPIKEQDGTTYVGAIQNFFNLAGFPGMVESHYTFGGGYNVSKDLSLDLAIVYAAEATESFVTTGAAAAGLSSPANVTHSQLGLTVAATYKF